MIKNIDKCKSPKDSLEHSLKLDILRDNLSNIECLNGQNIHLESGV